MLAWNRVVASDNSVRISTFRQISQHGMDNVSNIHHKTHHRVRVSSSPVPGPSPPVQRMGFTQAVISTSRQGEVQRVNIDVVLQCMAKMERVLRIPPRSKEDVLGREIHSRVSRKTHMAGSGTETLLNFLELRCKLSLRMFASTLREHRLRMVGHTSRS